MSYDNPYAFVPLDTYACDADSLRVLLLSSNEPFDRDGILLYHKCGHYYAGLTPLCLWVKPDQAFDLLLSDEGAAAPMADATPARQ